MYKLLRFWSEIRRKEKWGSKSNKSKCYHGEGGSCLNCLQFDKKEIIMSNSFSPILYLGINQCNHGLGGKCINCLGKEYMQNVKHISFDSYLEEKK